MVKNMADSRIVFHFYATSPGKAEEGKQSRTSSAAVSLTPPAKQIKEYFTLLFDD